MSNWTSTLAIDLFFFFFVRFRHLSNNRCVSVLRWFLIVFSPFSAFCVVAFRRRKKCERKQQQEVAYQSMLSNVCLIIGWNANATKTTASDTSAQERMCVCARGRFYMKLSWCLSQWNAEYFRPAGWLMENNVSSINRLLISCVFQFDKKFRAFW